jgi:hypothetical protein
MALERNVLQQHDFVIAAHFGKLAREVDRGIFRITLAIFLPRPRHALGRVQQALTRRIVPGPADQRANRLGHMLGHDDLAVRAKLRGIIVVVVGTAHGSSPAQRAQKGKAGARPAPCGA